MKANAKTKLIRKCEERGEREMKMEDRRQEIGKRETELRIYGRN